MSSERETNWTTSDDVIAHGVPGNVNEAAVEEEGTDERSGVSLNTNETAAEDADVAAHGAGLQTNEAVEEDDDVSAHGTGAQTNEIAVEDADVEAHAMGGFNVSETITEDES
jgi:hypothetical protein